MAKFDPDTAVEVFVADDIDEAQWVARRIKRACPVHRERNRLFVAEKDYILAALQLNGGNQTHTAEQLRIGSATLYRKLKSYGLITGKRAHLDVNVVEPAF